MYSVMSSNMPGSKAFGNMSVAELKVYLQERGVTVNGYLKPALITIATAVEKMMLPVDPNFEKEKADGKLIIHDMEIRDPFIATDQLVNDFKDSRPFGLYDIFNYLTPRTMINKDLLRTNHLRNIACLRTATSALS